MVGRTLHWQDELGRWLKPFLDRLGHKARRRMCPFYVSGLIGPGDRKSIQPMARRLALGESDQLHHFIAAGVWDAAPVETELLVQADRLVGGRDAVLVIDDTAIPKKGTHSVGVAAQYASTLGKTANCQTLVSLTLARGEVPVMLALRLFLPESWTSNRARLQRAGVPAEHRTARTKPELALAELDRVIAAGVRFGCVLADAGYGLSAPFRQGLTARKLPWAVGYSASSQGLPCRCADDLAGCQARPSPQAVHIPMFDRSRPKMMLVSCQMADHQLAHRAQKASSRLVLPQSACGSPMDHRSVIRDKGQQHLPGEEAWLIGEHRMSRGERNTTSPTCRPTTRSAHLGGYHQGAMGLRAGSPAAEGGTRPRSLRRHDPGQGLHRHALMTMIAYAFLQYRRLAAARRKKKNQRAHRLSQPCQPFSHAILELVARPPPQRCPHCRKWMCRRVET